ncbi:hypothetical protein KAU11_00565 [Candidatus Babeliales bacterium]|nr:hypothetical protein [Candidatus Babeliales bacterium]
MKQLLMIMGMLLFLMGNCWADSTVTLGWDANSENDLAGYRLYQTATKGEYLFGESHSVATIPAGTEICILSSVPDGEWWYVLTAFDNHDNESSRSNEVGVDLDTVGPNAPGFRLISVEVNR